MSRLSDRSGSAELLAQLGGVDPMTLTPRNVARIVRAADRLRPATNVRVAFCGTHSFEPLPEFLLAHGLIFGVGIAAHVAPYGQYMQQLMTDDSELLGFDPQIVMVSCALRQIAPRIHSDFGSVPPEELAAERDRILDHLGQAAEQAAARTSAIVLMANFPRPAHPALGIADGKQPVSEMEFYYSLNLELLTRFKDSDRIHIFDLDRLIGSEHASSAERMYFIAKRIWDAPRCNAIAQELLRYVVAATGRTRKCLVVDLDNTLWHGVVGEEGPDGVKVGPGSAIGEAFESHQHAIRALMSRGVLLAVSSKNNVADVAEVFARRKEMPLKWDDFAATDVSWNDKVSGLERLAAELNIGLDSMVFIDDNPAERAIVRDALPAIAVPELPPDPADYATFMRRLAYFEKPRVNKDDKIRLHDYAAQRGREQLRVAARDLEQYLVGLGTRIVVRRATASDLARVHELFSKTNQFNLTTHRYALGELQALLEREDTHLGVVTAEDRFSQMGTIGVYLLRRESDGIRLDSFLLSCRALGRGIETATMNCLKREVKEEFGASSLRAEFIPTAKNAPASRFLEQEGFRLVERKPEGTEEYVIEGASLMPRACAHVAIEHRMESNRISHEAKTH